MVCHDSGAANHIISWLKNERSLDNIQPYFEGPAREIWTQIFPNQQIVRNLPMALEGASSLLSGTGWASDLEHKARAEAKTLGLKTVAMLDHWANYQSRFKRKNFKVLPDEIWVVDRYAFDKAKKMFKNCKIKLLEDMYSANIIKEVEAEKNFHGQDLLYLLEPARSKWGRATEGEFQALNYMLSNLSTLKLHEKSIIKLRPHPSDPKGKYDKYLEKKFHRKIELDEGTLNHSLSQAYWVAGCETFALTIAIKLGKKTLCTLPPWAPPCRLPHTGITHLKSLVLK